RASASRVRTRRPQVARRGSAGRHRPPRVFAARQSAKTPGSSEAAPLRLPALRDPPRLNEGKQEAAPNEVQASGRVESLSHHFSRASYPSQKLFKTAQLLVRDYRTLHAQGGNGAGSSRTLTVTLLLASAEQRWRPQPITLQIVSSGFPVSKLA